MSPYPSPRKIKKLCNHLIDLAHSSGLTFSERRRCLSLAEMLLIMSNNPNTPIDAVKFTYDVAMSHANTVEYNKRDRYLKNLKHLGQRAIEKFNLGR